MGRLTGDRTGIIGGDKLKIIQIHSAILVLAPQSACIARGLAQQNIDALQGPDLAQAGPGPVLGSA